MNVAKIIGAICVGALLLACSQAFANEDSSSAQAFYVRQASLPPAAKASVRERRAKPHSRAVAAFMPSGGISGLVSASAARHGVPQRVAHAIVKIESGYNCKARSHANAQGIMQVLPATARGVGVHGSLYNCGNGLDAGMRYLRQIIAKHGTGCAALGLYERGAYARPVCTGYGRKAVRLASL